MPERRTQTDELADQMRPLRWGRFEKTLFISIAVLVVANLVVSVLTLGPDILRW